MLMSIIGYYIISYNVFLCYTNNNYIRKTIFSLNKNINVYIYIYKGERKRERGAGCNMVKVYPST